MSRSSVSRQGLKDIPKMHELKREKENLDDKNDCENDKDDRMNLV